ncbi:hypothetical protein BGZ68_007773 [Mortierella alpina]|nr:hypothetical protein BGZ68_007773 [Mortierella alpina]
MSNDGSVGTAGTSGAEASALWSRDIAAASFNDDVEATDTGLVALGIGGGVAAPGESAALLPGLELLLVVYGGDRALGEPGWTTAFSSGFSSSSSNKKS